MTTLMERAQARNGRIGPRARAERREAIALVVPALLPIIIFSVIPLVSGVALGFTDATLRRNAEINVIGLGNFIELAGDHRFWGSFGIGLIWSGAVALLTLVSAMGLALLLNADLRLKTLTRMRNGIYGAMWAAGLCAAALVAAGPREVLDAADAVVPPGSRLAAAVALGRETGRHLAAGELDEPAALDALHADLGHLHWVHTLNNAALIACAVEAAAAHDARTGYARGIALAVAGGWDTDSAGATVGSVLGALAGADGIDPAWTAPLRGRIATSLPPSALPSSKRRGGAAGERSIEELAERTAALPERITQ